MKSRPLAEDRMRRRAQRAGLVADVLSAARKLKHALPRFGATSYGDLDGPLADLQRAVIALENAEL